MAFKTTFDLHCISEYLEAQVMNWEDVCPQLPN